MRSKHEPKWREGTKEHVIFADRSSLIPCRGMIVLELPLMVYAPSGHYAIIEAIAGTPVPVETATHINGRLVISLSNATERDIIVPKGREVALVHARTEIIKTAKLDDNLATQWDSLKGDTIVVEVDQTRRNFVMPTKTNLRGVDPN